MLQTWSSGGTTPLGLWTVKCASRKEHRRKKQLSVNLLAAGLETLPPWPHLQAARFPLQFRLKPLRDAAVSSSTQRTKLKVGKINDDEITSSVSLSISGKVFQLKLQTQTIIIHDLPPSELGGKPGQAGARLFILRSCLCCGKRS